MAQDAKSTRHNRTITVDFHNEATYFALLSDGKAFQTPPDVVVKFQLIDIVGFILCRILRLRVVYQREIKG